MVKLKSLGRFYAAETATAAGGGAAAPVKLSGVTMQERASRSAQERDLSPDNERIVPGMTDILGHLNLSGVKLEDSEAVEQPATEATEAETIATEQEPVETELEAEPETEEPDPTETEPEPEEEPEQAAAEGEPEIGEVIEADGKKFKLPPEVQASLNSRFGELTAKRKEAEALVAAITAERDQFKAQAEGKAAVPVRIAPTPEQPLADVNSPAELSQAAAEANEVKLFCLANPDGVEVVKNAETGEKEFLDAARIRELRIGAERALAAVPQRQQFLAIRQECEAIGRKAFPEYFTPGTQQAQRLAAARSKLPWLGTYPEGDLIIVQAMEGKKVMDAKLAGKPALKPAPAKVHIAPTPRPAPRLPARVVDQRKGASQFEQSRGDQKSLQRVAERLVGV
jgi:antitoxin component HigA of HigAB toxin-antitoxin module